MKYLIVSVLRVYKKLVSPILTMFLGHACRFNPTCSDYSIEAIDKYGVGKGLTLSLKRISRCHPLSKPGYDPLL